MAPNRSPHRRHRTVGSVELVLTSTCAGRIGNRDSLQGALRTAFVSLVRQPSLRSMAAFLACNGAVVAARPGNSQSIARSSLLPRLPRPLLAPRPAAAALSGAHNENALPESGLRACSHLLLPPPTPPSRAATARCAPTQIQPPLPLPQAVQESGGNGVCRSLQMQQQRRRRATREASSSGAGEALALLPAWRPCRRLAICGVSAQLLLLLLLPLLPPAN